MKLIKRIGKWIAGAAAVALFVATPMTAFADEPIVNNGNGSISIVYHDLNNDPIYNMRVRIYQVATVEGEIFDGAVSGYHVTYTVTPEFQQFDETTGDPKVTGFSEEKLNEALKIKDGESQADRRARWQRIAASLEPYVATRVNATGDENTDVDGDVTFTGLQSGLYLLIADGEIVGSGPEDYQYSYAPTFVALPGYANGVWDYGVDLDFNDGNTQLRPKYEYTTVPYEYTVYKRWLNDNATVRPTEVIVDIYRDDVLFRTVTLNEANGWRYTWTGGRRYNWRVVERSTAQYYSVAITEVKWNGEFTITNTYNPPPDDPPPDDPPPENPPPTTPPPTTPPTTYNPPPEQEVLGVRRVMEGETAEVLGVRRRSGGEAVLGIRRMPQAGQLWWPVPVLAGAGALLFAVGVARRKKANRAR